MESILSESILDLEHLKSETSKAFSQDKQGIFDIKVMLSTGAWVNIEIQLRWTHDYPERTLYYWSKMYTDNFTEGQDYSTLRRCIAINIIDKYFSLNDRLHSSYSIREEKSGQRLSDKLEIHFINLEKIRLQEFEGVDEKLLWWLQFIEAYDPEVRKMLSKKSAGLEKASEIINRIPKDAVQREYYIAQEKAVRDRVSMYNTGKLEGLEEGREEGKMLAAIEIAQQLLATGMDREDICKLTKLDTDDF